MDSSDTFPPSAEGVVRDPNLVWTRVGDFKVPKPFNGEHLLSWCGRAYRANDVQKVVGTESSFQSYLPFKVDSLAELAALAGMDLDQLFRRHTIGPYMRAVTRDLVPVNLQGRRAPALNSKLRNSSTWGGLRFCPDCVKRDLDRHGVAYWRRMHLLPGVFWCSVHGTALVRPDIKTTFVQEPGLHLLAEDDLKFDEKRLCDVHPAIQRYVHLAMLTLRRCHSVGTTTISARLKSLVLKLK